MQNLVQRIMEAALLAACVIESANAAAIVGNPRDVLEIEFILTAVQFPSPPRPQGSHWALSYGDDRVDIGDILRFRLFEDSRADEPNLDVYYDGTYTGNGFLGFFGPSDHFQDLQGLLLIELYEGSVSIDSIFAETYLSGERYRMGTGPWPCGRGLGGFCGAALIPDRPVKGAGGRRAEGPGTAAKIAAFRLA